MVKDIPAPTSPSKATRVHRKQEKYMEKLGRDTTYINTFFFLLLIFLQSQKKKTMLPQNKNTIYMYGTMDRDVESVGDE